MAAAAPPHHLRNRRRLCYLRLARSVVGPAGRDVRAARRPGRRWRAAGPGLTAAVWLAICSGQAALARMALPHRMSCGSRMLCSSLCRRARSPRHR